MDFCQPEGEFQWKFPVTTRWANILGLTSTTELEPQPIFPSVECLLIENLNTRILEFEYLEERTNFCQARANSWKEIRRLSSINSSRLIFFSSKEFL